MRTQELTSVRLAIALAIPLIALATSASAASAPDRPEYVSRLESICKPGVEETQRAVRGVRSDVSAERLGIASRKLFSAEKIFDRTVRRISAVPRPPADAAQLKKWFSYLADQKSYLRKAALALGAQRIVAYQHNAVRFVHTGNLANDVVISFGFNYCRFKFRRFE